MSLDSISLDTNLYPDPPIDPNFTLEPSHIQAFHYFNLAAKQNLPEALYLKGLHLIHSLPYDPNDKNWENTDLEEGFENIEKAFNLDHIPAGLTLAECYLNGIGTERNNNEAIHILRNMATKNSESKAMYQLAEIYRTGKHDQTNHEGDIQLSAHWMKLASLKNLPEAQYGYAKMLNNDEILPGHEYTKSPAFTTKKQLVMDLLTKSSIQGYALSHLAISFELVKQTPPDINSAINSLYKAAYLKCPEAQYLFSLFLSKKLNSQLQSTLPNDGIHPGSSVTRVYTKPDFDTNNLEPEAEIGPESQSPFILLDPKDYTIDIDPQALKQGEGSNHFDPIYWLTLSANSEYTLAMFYLACEYFRIAMLQEQEQEQNHNINELNESTARFWELATNLFQKASKNQNSDSNYFLGLIYENGYGTDSNIRNPELAVKYYSLAAMNGHPASEFKLASCTERGFGTKPDPSRAKLFYTRAALQGHPESQYNLGIIYKTEGDFTNATKYLITAAQNGISEANYTLGFMSSASNSNINNENLAYFKAAADSGHPKALYTMGLLYSRGVIAVDSNEGTNLHISLGPNAVAKQDIPLALKYFTLAAQRGHSEAQYAIALASEKGIYTPRNLENAIKWYTKAANQGHPLSCLSLGNHHLGLHSKYSHNQDLTFAKTWFELAIKNANSTANSTNPRQKQILPASQFSLCLCYEIEQDWETAVSWAKKAAIEHNFPSAQIWLSTRFSKNNQGVSHNYEKALEWATKASQSSPKGKAHLASLLLHGDSQGSSDMATSLGANRQSPETLKKVFQLFDSAVSQLKQQSGTRDPSIYVGLANCYFNGIGTPISYRKAFLLYSQTISNSNSSGKPGRTSEIYPPVYYHLGFCWATGAGTDSTAIDEEDSVPDSEKSINQKNDSIEEKVDHTEAEVGPIDLEKAQYYYEIAAKHGFAPAQYNLAALLENKSLDDDDDDDDGTPPIPTTLENLDLNIQGALYWYFQAAEQNHPHALSRFKRLEQIHVKGFTK